MGYYQTEKSIVSAIASAKEAGIALKNEHHKIAISILRKWCKDGNAGFAAVQLTSLNDAIGDAGRQSAFKKWVETFTLMTWENSENTFRYTSTTIDMDVCQEANLTKNRYWTMTPPSEYKSLDWVKALETLIKKAEKDIEELGDKSKVSVAELDALKEVHPKA